MVRGCRRKTRITRHQVILFVLMCQSHAPVFSTARSRAPLLWRRFVPFHSCRFRDVGGVVNGPWDHNPLFRHLVAYLSIFLSCHLRTLLLHVGYLEAPLLNLRPPPPPLNLISLCCLLPFPYRLRFCLNTQKDGKARPARRSRPNTFLDDYDALAAVLCSFTDSEILTLAHKILEKGSLSFNYRIRRYAKVLRYFKRGSVELLKPRSNR